jgi:cell division protein FtsA
MLIRKLSRRLEPQIEKVYVGVGGQSLRTVPYSVSLKVGGIVTQEIINSLWEECRRYEPEVVEILDIVYPEFYLDGKLESNPRGISCKTIEAKFQLIVGRPSLKNYLRKSVEEKAGITIAGFFILPLATASAVLSDTEKDLGCALVEFGAGITYLSVYKEGLLRYLVSIPLGGNIITKDICDLGILEKDAEELKISLGNALPEQEVDANKNGTENNISDDDKKVRDLNIIIEARTDEIIANIIEQLKQSGYDSLLRSGIVITGGGASLNNLRLSLQKKTGKDVRLSTARKTLVNQAAEITGQPANSAVIGLLSLSKENCAKKEEAPKITPGYNIFGEPESENKPVRGTRIVKDTIKDKEKDPPKETGRLRGLFDRLVDTIYNENENGNG